VRRRARSPRLRRVLKGGREWPDPPPAAAVSRERQPSDDETVDLAEVRGAPETARRASSKSPPPEGITPSNGTARARGRRCSARDCRPSVALSGRRGDRGDAASTSAAVKRTRHGLAANGARSRPAHTVVDRRSRRRRLEPAPPGEVVTLDIRGVVFIDELGAFPPHALDRVAQQPIEEPWCGFTSGRCRSCHCRLSSSHARTRASAAGVGRAANAPNAKAPATAAPLGKVLEPFRLRLEGSPTRAGRRATAERRPPSPRARREAVARQAAAVRAGCRVRRRKLADPAGRWPR